MRPGTAVSRAGSRFLIGQRVLLSVVGGYALSAGLASLGAWVASLLMSRSESATLMGMLAFIIYMVVLLWAFAERRLLRLWWVLGVGPFVVWTFVWALQAIRWH